MGKINAVRSAVGCGLLLFSIFNSGHSAAKDVADEKSFQFENGAGLHFVVNGNSPGVYYSPPGKKQRTLLVSGQPTAIPHSKHDVAQAHQAPAPRLVPFQERLQARRKPIGSSPPERSPTPPPINGSIQLGGIEVPLINSEEHQAFMIANVDNVFWAFAQNGKAFQLPAHDEFLYKGFHQGLVFEAAIVDSDGQPFLVVDFPFDGESSEFARGEVFVADMDGDFVRSTRMSMGKPDTSPTIQGLRIENGKLQLTDCVRDEVDLQRFKAESDWEGSISKSIRFRDGNKEQEVNPVDWVTRYFQRFTLNMPAIRKSADPIDPKEFDGMRSALLRRKIGNFVILGPAGSGKTELMNAFVRKLLNGDFPEFPRTMKVFELNAAALSSGAWLVGITETRTEALAEVAKSGPVLIIADELHALRGTGSYEGKSSDFFESIKQGMANGEIHIGGTTTEAEFDYAFIGNRPLFDRFVKLQKKLLIEPEVLKAIRFALRSYHRLEVSDEVVARIYENSQMYNAIGAQPRKATSLADEVGARWKMDGRQDRPLTTDDVDRATLHLYGVDPAEFTPAKRIEKLNRAWQLLRERYVGQEETIRKLFDYLAISLTSYFDPTKPRGLFLFLGDTGLGKTELAEILANALNVPLVKISLSTLDYVNEGRDALLRPIAQALRANAHSLVLLDELEKVPTALLDSLLEVFDKGVFETSEQQSNSSRAGTTRVPVNARNAIFIGTTNAGSSLSGQDAQEEIGYGKRRSSTRPTRAAIKRTLANDGLSRPLLNRFFEIFVFKYYSEKEMHDILQVKFKQIFATFADRKGVEMLEEALKDFDEHALIAELAQAYKGTEDGAREAIFALRLQLAKFLAERQLQSEAAELGMECIQYLQRAQ